MTHSKEGRGQSFWIMKSEPADFYILDLKRVKREPWTGVRNFQVRNMMRDKMQVGDRAFLYHSSCMEVGIVGEMRIVSSAYPDPLQFDAKSDYYDKRSKKESPLWLCVDVEYIESFDRRVSLDEVRTMPVMKDSPLIARGNRLSVIPISEAQYQAIRARAVQPMVG